MFEDHEVSVVFVGQRADLLFSPALVVLCDGDDGVGDFVEVGDGLVVGVVGDDQGNIAG
jgi:hypothetical protein